MLLSNSRNSVRGLLIAALAGGLAVSASAGEKNAGKNTAASKPRISGVGYLDNTIEEFGTPVDAMPVGDRGPGCTSTACIGNINPAATDTLNGVWSDLNGSLPNNPNTVLDSKVAENITLNATGDITQVCWVGIYTNYPVGQTTATTLAAPPVTRTFAVSYYADAGGLPCIVPLARFFVGATAPDAGTTFDQVQITPPNGTRYRFTATHPAVPVTAGQCVWVEIVDVDPTLAGTFRWSGALGLADNLIAWYLAFPEGGNDALDLGYAPGDLFTGAGDRVVCVNVGATLAANACPAIPTGAPANDMISTPQALTIGAAAVSGTTLGATEENGIARPCGSILADSPGVWYSFVGNGNTITITTDFGGGCSDPQFILYDADAFIGTQNGSDLVCVGTADDTEDSLNPVLEICSAVGKNYLVYVQGFDGGAASFDIAVQDGAVCNTPTPGQNCNVVAQMGDFLEENTEACSLRNNDGCPGAAGNEVPLALTLGTPIYGHVENNGTTRDRDRYQITFVAPTEVTVSLTAEFPALFLVWECDGAVETPILETVVVFDTCETVPFNILLPAGDFAFTVMPNGFQGLEDCTMTFNDYRLTVSAATTGACCTGTSCALNTEINCGNTDGRFLGASEPCDPGACNAACDVVQGGATPETEACQGAALEAGVDSPNGSCATAQPITGPVFGNFSTDTGGLRDLDFYSFTTTATGDITVALESELPAVVQLVSCPSEAPLSPVTDVAACVRGTPVVFEDQPAGSYAVIVASADFGGLPCNGGVNDYLLTVTTGGGGPTPCERADFDNSGTVDATDIFIFLDAWFAQNGMTAPGLSADTDGSGTVDATDIFIYLDLWFANNGQTC